MKPPPISRRALEHAAAAGRRASVSRRADARRDRQRQDRGLPAACRCRQRSSGRGVLMLVPEIALTPQVAALFRARFGAGGRHSAQRPVGRRAPRSVASHPPRRCRRRDRHALGGVRAAREPRPDHRRRGARHLVQAGRDAALSRPRRGDHARQVRERAGRDRLGDADDRVVHERARRALHAGDDGQARARSAARARQRRQHARGDRGSGRRRGVEPCAGRGDAGAARSRGAVADPAESARLRDGGGLPSVHGDARVPELQHLPDRAFTSRTTAGWRRCHYCNFSKPVPKTCEKCAAPYMERVGFGTERVEAEIRKLFPDGAHRARRSRHRAPQGQSGRDPRQGGEPRDRHPDRHADDRQGPRLSATARWSA